MHRSKFAYLSLIGLGLLLAFLVLFPGILTFLVQAALQGKNCADPQLECDAIPAAIAAFVKPAGIFIIGALLVWVLNRRLHFLDFGGEWTLIAALWVLGSIPYLGAAQNFWGGNISMGLLYVPLPFSLAYLVVFLTFLYFVKYAPASAPDTRQQKAWRVVLISTGYVLLVSVPTILNGTQMVPYVGGFVNPELPLLLDQVTFFLRLGLPLTLVMAIGFLVLSGSLAYIIYCQNRIEGAMAAPAVAEKPALGTPSTNKPHGRSFGQRKTV